MLGFEILIKAQLEMAQFNREQAELMQRMIKTNNEYLKTKMKSETWFKRSECAPSGDYTSYVLGGYDVQGRWIRTVLNEKPSALPDFWTHWCGIESTPPPPAKKPTQEEKDIAFIKLISAVYSEDRTIIGSEGLIGLTLRKERSVILDLLQRFDNHQMNEKELIAMIRGRVR